MRTINRGLGSSVFRQYGMGESGKTAIEVLQSFYTSTITSTAPTGYSWTILNGAQVYHNNLPVFDDGYNFYVQDL